MNLDKSIKSSLSEPAREALKVIDNVIDIYISKGVKVDIEVNHREFDAIQKSLKKHKHDLTESTYRGFKLARKLIQARKRYRRTDVEAFNFSDN